MALPPENRTPRMVRLETFVARTPREKLMDFPVLEPADHQLIGAFIQEFNYIDFNLRRVIEPSRTRSFFRKADGADLKGCRLADPQTAGVHDGKAGSVDRVRYAAKQPADLGVGECVG